MGYLTFSLLPFLNFTIVYSIPKDKFHIIQSGNATHRKSVLKEGIVNELIFFRLLELLLTSHLLVVHKEVIFMKDSKQ